jgi:hypothetical protein
LVRRWSTFRTIRTTDDVWRQWLRKVPDANIALVAGTISGVDVLDVEVEGLTHPLVQTLPPTPTQRSQRGGHHYFFRHVAGLKNRRWQDGDLHLGDFKTEGGYVALAPSRGVVGQYLWLSGRSPIDVPLAQLPEWLVELARDSRPAERAERRSARHLADVIIPPPPPLPAGLALRIVDTIRFGLPKGQRSEGLASVINSLCAAGLKDPEIVSLILHSPIGEKAREKPSPIHWLLARVEDGRAYFTQQSAMPTVLARIESVEELRWTGHGWRIQFSVLIAEGKAAGKIIHERVSTYSDHRRVAAFTQATGLPDPWSHWHLLPGRLLRVTVRDADAYGQMRVARFFPVEGTQ